MSDLVKELLIAFLADLKPSITPEIPDFPDLPELKALDNSAILIFTNFILLTNPSKSDAPVLNIELF